MGSNITLSSLTNGGTYAWTGPAGFTANTQNPSVNNWSAANNGVYTLVITYGPGCATAPATINLTGTAIPTAAINPAATQTICAGQAVTYTATGSSNVNGYTWDWNFFQGQATTKFCTVIPAIPFVQPASTNCVNNPISFPGTTGGASITYTPSQSSQMCVTIQNAAGCTDKECVNVVVLPAAASLTISPSVTICPAQSTTLTASGGSSYTWTPATALSTTSGSVTVANPTTTTVYTVSSPGCSGTQSRTVQVTVGGTPPAIGAINGTTTICPNATGVTYSVTNVASTSYTWSVPAGATITSGTNTNAITVNFGSTAGTISVFALGTCGSATAAITVNLNPAINLTVTPNNPTICAGGSVALTASGATNYTWSPSASLSSPNGANVTASPVITTIYTITGATGGCTGSTTATVTIGGGLTLTVTPNTSTVCAGNPVDLTASGATSYTWSPSATLSSPNGSTVTATPAGATTYTVIGATGTCTGSATASISLGGALTLTLTSNTPTVCPGASALLDANGATNYTWSPAATLSSANGSNVTASPLSSTIYTVVGATGGCTGTATISVGIGACVSSACDLNAIRTALTGAGNIELLGMNNTCSLYFINPQFMTGPQAQAYAQTFGANLISVQSASENADLVQALSNQGYSAEVIWIGYSDETTEGSFVWYDGSPVVYSNWAPGEPNNAGDEDCTQIYPDGGWNDLNCAGYNSLSVIEVNICPQVTVVNPPLHCPGTNVPITASTLLGSPGYTYTWVQSGTETFTNTSSPGNTDQITVTSMAANTFTVYSEDRYSCPQSAVVTLSVNPSPTITANSATICAGETATLTANGAVTYSWIPGTGLSSTTDAVVTGTPPSSQSYTVIGMDANGCLNGTITAITVNPVPVIGVSANSTICPQTSTVLTATGANTYTWSPAASLSSSNGSTVTATPATSTIYTVTGSNGNCTATNTVSVEVENGGFPPSVYIIQKNSLCDTSVLNWVNVTSVTSNLAQGTLPNGINVTATHSGSGLSSTPSMFGGGNFPVSYNVPQAVTTIRNDLAGVLNFCFSQPVVNPQIAFASIGQPALPITIVTSVPYQVLWTGIAMTYVNPTTLTGAEGYTIIRFPGTHSCVSLNYLGDETYINLAVGVMDAACQGQPVCPGTPVELIANGAATYSWNTGATTTTITPAPSVTTTYSVLGTTAGGCANTATTTVVVLPSPTITVNSSTICVGQQTATLTANGADTYTWAPAATLSSSTGSVVTGTPVSTQVYTITGTDLNGCVNDTTTSITVNPLPIINVNSATICVGQQTGTLTATGALTYSWIPGTGLNQTTGSVVTGTPGSTQNYTVGGIDGNGCINGTITAITVNPLPTVTVNSSTICIGQQTATLTANGASTYSWSPGTGLVSTTGSVVTGTPITSQNYTVTGTDANGCFSDNTTTITVNPLPVITVNSASICLGQQTATLTANGATTYSWIPGTGLSATTGSVVTGTPGATQVYTVGGIDANGCINGTTSTITINPLPVVTAPANMTVCPLSSNTLTASGAASYTWSPNLYLNNNTSATVISTPSVTTTYTIDGLTGECTASNTVTIVVNNTVVVNATAATPTICPLASTSLTATGATTYTWSPSLTLSSANGSTVTSAPSTSTTYTVIGSTSTCTNSAEVVVTVTVNPTISVAGTPPVICSGASSSLNASGASTYTWSPGTGLSATNGSPVNANPNTTSIYNISGTSLLGCTSFTTFTLAVVPTPTVTGFASPTAICAGSSSTLTAFGASNYTWSPGASVSNVNGTPAIASPAQTTTYTIIGSNGTAPFLCSTSNTVQVLVKPNPTVTTGPDQTICEGKSAPIYANGAASYNWSPSGAVMSPNDSVTDVYPLVTTSYTVTGTTNNCSSTATVQVFVNPLPSVNAGVDTTVNIDNTITLVGTGSNYNQLGFLPSSDVSLLCNYCPTITVNPQDYTCYTLEAISVEGCKNTDVVCVTVTKDWDVFIPNAFTPNGDLINEVFIPMGYGISEIKLTIFDRWGSVVFKSTEEQIGWDGKENGRQCEQGVYIYQVEVVAMSGAKYKKTGHVTLLPRIK
jgi:gliding motility-associated-like protein